MICSTSTIAFKVGTTKTTVFSLLRSLPAVQTATKLSLSHAGREAFARLGLFSPSWHKEGYEREKYLFLWM